MSKMSAIDKLALKLANEEVYVAEGGYWWKPLLHPRDHNGKFEKKGAGTFTLLHNLKTANVGVYNGPAGHSYGVSAAHPDIPAGHKIGGVNIHAPTEHGYKPSVHSIDYSLAPGEKVYKVTHGPEQGAQNGVIVHHATGGASVLLPTPEGESPKLGLTHTHFSDLHQMLTSVGYHIDTEHPLDENPQKLADQYIKPAEDFAKAKELTTHNYNYGDKHIPVPSAISGSPLGTVAQHNETGQFGAFDKNGKLVTEGHPTPIAAAKALKSHIAKQPFEAPKKEEPKPAENKPSAGGFKPPAEGNGITHVKGDNGEHLGHIEKTPEGKFISHNAKGEKVGNISKHMHTAVEKVKSGKLTTPSTYTHKKPLKKAAAEAAKEAPKVPELKVEAPKPEPKPEPKVEAPATKPVSKIPSMGEIGPGGNKVVSNIFNNAGQHIGHVEKTQEGKFTSHNAKGEKIGNIAKHLDTAVAKVHTQKPIQAPKKVEPLQNAVVEWDVHGKHIVKTDSGAFLGHVEKADNGKWQSYDAHGKKLGYTIGSLPYALDKVKAQEAPKPIEKPVEKAPEPNPEPKIYTDKVTQAFEKANNDAAKKYQVPGYDGHVMLAPGEAVYVEDLNKPHGGNWAPVVANGKVQKLVNITFGDEFKSPSSIKSWQDMLDKGKLVKAVENPPENAPVPQEIKDEVTKIEKSILPEKLKAETPKPPTTTPVQIYQASDGSEIHIGGDGLASIYNAEGKLYTKHTSVAQSEALIHNVIGKPGWTKTLDNTDKPSVKAAKPLAGATPKVAKPKAKKDSELPDSYQWGTVGDLKAKPGDTIWTKENGSVLHISGVTGKSSTYEPDGSKNLWDSHAKITQAAAKKQGWTKVAQGAPKEELKFPTAEPSMEFNTSNLFDSYTYNVAAKTIGYQTAWQNEGAGSDLAGTQLATAIANVESGKKSLGDILSKSVKMQSTKALKNLQALMMVHVIAKRLADPNYEVTEQDKTNLTEAHNQVKKLYNANNEIQKLVTTIKQKDFQKKIGDIGFDLATGTDEQYANYAIKQGANFVGGMTPDQVKSWVNTYLNVPGHSGESKESIEKAASTELKFKSIAAHADAVVAKKVELAKNAKSPQVVKAEAKKLDSLYKTASNLQEQYTTKNGFKIYYDPSADTWTLKVSPTDKGTQISPLEVAQTLYNNNEGGVWEAAGHKVYKNYAATIGKQLQSQFGEFWKEAPAPMLKKLGVAGADHIKTEEGRQAWLRAYLRGDEVGQYNILKKWYPEGMVGNVLIGPDHPGSPKTPAGEKTRQALSDYLNTQEWWVKNKGKSLDQWDVNDIISAGDHLGLIDANTEIPFQSGVPGGAFKEWLDTHTDLPEPKNLPSVSSAKVESTTGSVEIPNGSLVAKTNAGQVHIYAPDKYSLNNGESYLKYPGTFDQQSAHAADMAAGYTDVTPKWTNSGIIAKNLAEKPSTVSDEMWNFVTGAEHGGKELSDFVGDGYTKMPEDQVALKIQSNAGLTAAQKFQMQSAPEGLKKLAAWAYDVQSDYYSPLKGKAAEISKSLAAKADAGEYVTPETATWKHPVSGKTYAIPAGAKLYKYTDWSGTDYYTAVMPGGGLAYSIRNNGSVMVLHGQQDISGYIQSTPIFTAPEKLTLDKAHSEGHSFSQAALSAVDKAEEQPAWTSNGLESTAAYEFKSAIKNIDGGIKYSHLVPELHTLPVGVKQLALNAAFKKDTNTLDAIAWKHAKGAYNLHPTQVETSPIPSGASYASIIAQGKTSESDITTFWSISQANAFVKDFNLPISPHAYFDEKAKLIANKLAEINSTASTEPTSKAGLHDTANLVLTKIEKSYGGMHGKQGYTDQQGNEWMAKFYTHDPNSKLRVDAEHYANLMGRLFGFNSPETFARTVDGKYSIVQNIVDNNGSLNGHGVKDLNQDQLHGAMQEHVLDWLLSNHDSHPDNLLLHPDGHSIIGIDKGQAFKHLHDDKLAVGYLPKENPVATWYDQGYKAIANGALSQQQADDLAFAVLAKAYYVQTRHDDKFRELVGKALATRDFWPGDFPNKEAFIDGVMERKHSLVLDFEKLYKQQFKKAGYEWHVDTENFGKKVGDAHVSNNPIYAKEVSEAGAAGKALFFASKHLEDSHIMFAPMHHTNGQHTLVGSAKITNAEADKALHDWLKERLDGGLAHGMQSTPTPVSKPEAVLPMVDALHQSTVNLLKTVKTHATNGGNNPDGQYNADTVASAESTAQKAQTLLDDLKSHRAENPDKLFAQPVGNLGGSLKLSTLEQQDALISALDAKLKEYNIIHEAYKANTSPKLFDPNLGQLEPVSYTPSPGLDPHSQAKVAEKWKLSGGEILVKTSDGGHYVTSADGNVKTWVSKQEYGNASFGSTPLPVDPQNPATWKHNGKVVWEEQPDGMWQNIQTGVLVSSTADLQKKLAKDPSEYWTYDPGSTAPKEESAEIQVAETPLKVTHGESKSTGGKMDFNTGELMKGNATKGKQTGYEYTVESGNVLIRYRPWNEYNVAAAQKGLISIEVKNWDKGHQAIDQAIQTLELMGVDVTPADAKSLELQYWRTMSNIIQDRADSHSTNKKVIDKLTDSVMDNHDMSTDEELSAHREAWAARYGQDVVDNASWAPRFTGSYGKDDTGRPHWVRPDFSLEDLKNIYGNRLVKSTMTGSTHDAMDRVVDIMKTGKLLSTEERLRVLGLNLETMSPGDDQHKGSSAFVFTRQNMRNSPEDTAPEFLFSPDASLRIHNYAYSDDHYGDITQRKNSAYWAGDTMYNYGNGGSDYSSNELMIKNDVPIYAVIFQTGTARDKLIARLKAEGITGLAGRELADVIFSAQQWEKEREARVEKLWKELIEKEKKFAKSKGDV